MMIGTRKKVAVYSVLACILFVGYFTTALASSITLEIPAGKLAGFENDGIVVFKGIPYAKPPVGDRRFAPPEDVESWDGILNCQDYGHTAVQNKVIDGLPMSEDCLTLNIWTPTLKNDAKLPVYVFIHGGGYATGSGADLKYAGDNFAKNGIVAVTINYRLNALGFFASKETLERYGTTGNWGHLDQIKALEWVRDNIAAFGGDPDNVTIGGESAGSYSVSALILSPLAKGLFHGAILESGSILAAAQTSYYAKGDLERSIELCNMMARMLDAEDNAVGLAKMRTVDARVLSELSEFQADQTRMLAFFLMPVFDGGVLPKEPYKALMNGEFNHVRLLWGYNTDEGSLFVSKDADENKYRMMAAMALGYDKAQAVLERFPVDGLNDGLARTRQLLTYTMFLTGMKVYADKMADDGLDVYAYHYAYVPPETAATGMGASHGLELAYVFGNPATIGFKGAEHETLAREMHLRWVNFIKNGDPNVGAKPPTGAAWPKYNPEKPRLMRFDRQVTVENLQNFEDVQFMEKVIFGTNR